MSDFNISKIKKLINIDLSEKEEENIKKDIEDILDYVEKIADIKDSEINYFEKSVDVQNIVHIDTIEKKQYEKKIKENFPKKIKDYLAVPKYLGDD